MRKTAEITGQNLALSELISWLEHQQSSQCVVIEGPAGSGKSWLVEELKSHPYASEHYLFIRAAGDATNTARPLLPFYSALVRTQRITQVLKGVAAAGAQASPFRTGALAGFMVDAVLNWKEKNNAALTPFLTGTERDILTELNVRVGKSPLVFVLDDLQSWDEASLNLVKLMLGDHLHRAFPFLRLTKFIAVIRSDLPSQSKDWKHFRTLFGEHVLKLGYCKQDDFKDLLASLGMKSTPSIDECRSLHHVTQGHLRLARDIARLDDINKATLTLQTHHFDLDSMCSHLMAKRLDELGERGEALANMLTRAAAIGLTFTKTEIRCLLDNDAPRLAEQMRDASSLELINIEGEAYAFRHDLFLRYFANRPVDEEENLHARFSECLRKLRPGQYEARRQHLSLAGDVHGAANMGVHACLSLNRDARLTPARRLALVEHAGRLARFVDSCLQAQNLCDEGRYTEALALLDEIDPTYSEGLLAEKAILAARCSIKLLTHEAFQAAIKILDEASSVIDHEPEVWSRVMLTRFVARAYAGDMDGAKSDAKMLCRWAESRQTLDPDAARILHRLKVKADMYLIPESAAASLDEACAYFGHSHDNNGVRDPVNYFIALTNLSGNELMRGDFSRAYATAAKANFFLQQCRKTGEVGNFPRIDMHLNNLIVAGWRSGALDLPSCVEAFVRLVQHAPATNDKPLLRSNLAVLQIMAGDLTAPTDTLSELFASVSVRTDYDAYYVYFIGNNLAGALFASGQVDKAKAVWKRLDQAVRGLDSTRLPYRKRHDIQAQCFGEPMHEASPEMWDTHITRRTAIPLEGPSWSFIGKGFLLSDLQYWSDD